MYGEEPDMINRYVDMVIVKTVDEEQDFWNKTEVSFKIHRPPVCAVD